MPLVRDKQVTVDSFTPTNYTTASSKLGANLSGINDKLGTLIEAGRVGDVIIIEDQKPSGTGGGTFTSGAWRTRDLNTVVADTGGHASVASNQITLAAGTYTIQVVAPIRQVNSAKLRLQNITDGTTIAEGSSVGADAASSTGQDQNNLFTRFTLNSTKVIEVQHQCSFTNALGFGSSVGASFTIDHETYTQVLLLREADSDGGAGATQIPMDYALIEDQKASGTDGGTFTSGAWRTRDLNTIVADTGSNVSVASNQITLAAGTYVVNATGLAYLVSRHQIRLQNITNGTTLFSGLNAFSQTSGSVGAMSQSTLSGTFTLSISSVLELQHQCSLTKASNGFGFELNSVFAVDHETYSRVELWKLPATATAGPGLPRGYIDGLILSNNATDALHDIDISAGETRDSTNAQDISLSATFIKQIDAAWAEGTGLGGFPSALTLTADTWYHVFLIFNRATGKTDAGFDTSITAANLLTDSGYTHYRRLGSVLTDASSTIIAFSQVGDKYLWTVPPLDVNTTTTGSSANFTLSVPPGLVVDASIVVLARDDASSFNALVYSPNHSDIVAAGGRANLQGPSAGVSGVGQFVTQTNTASQVREDDSSALTAFIILTLGWVDPRGKDAA